MSTSITANGINFPNGSAGTPSVAGSDTDTGLFYGTDIVGFATGGSERLRIDASGNINIANDSGKLQLGTSADLQIYHNGTDSIIDDTGTGKLVLKGSTKVEVRSSGNEDMAVFTENGAVELYHDNSKRLETKSDGIQITGSGNNSNITTAYGDLQLINTSDDINLYSADDIDLYVQSNEAAIKCIGNGQVELYYDNGLKADTMADGFRVKYSDDSGATTLKLENNSTHNSQNPKVKIAVDLATGKNGGSIEFIRGNNYQSSAAADSEIVISPTKNDSNTEIVRITQDWFRLHSNCSGIQFNSDTAQANALNDYEEGTYTAHFAIEGQGNMSMSGRVGLYVKVGQMVTVIGGGTVSSVSGAGSGTAIEFSNLPFPVHNSSSGNGHPFAVKMYNLDSTGISNMGGSAPYGWIGRLYTDATYGRIEGISASGSQNPVNAGLALASNSEIHYMFTYITDA